MTSNALSAEMTVIVVRTAISWRTPGSVIVKNIHQKYFVGAVFLRNIFHALPHFFG